jgi:hypothetical protein
MKNKKEYIKRFIKRNGVNLLVKPYIDYIWTKINNSKYCDRVYIVNLNTSFKTDHLLSLVYIIKYNIKL